MRQWRQHGAGIYTAIGDYSRRNRVVHGHHQRGHSGAHRGFYESGALRLGTSARHKESARTSGAAVINHALNFNITNALRSVALKTIYFCDQFTEFHVWVCVLLCWEVFTQATEARALMDLIVHRISMASP